MKKVVRILTAVLLTIFIFTSCSYGQVAGSTSEVNDVSGSSVPMQEDGQAAALLTAAGDSTNVIVYDSADEAVETAAEWDALQLDAEEVFSYDSENIVMVWEDQITESYSLEDGSVEITSAGVYQLSGELDGGQVVVNAGKDDLVVLVLDSVSITSVDAPIYIENADTTIIVLAEESVNYLSDTSVVIDSSADDGDMAVIFSKDDLTITGSGSLEISANRDNGIQSKDSVLITGGEIEIEAIDDGIVGKDDITIIDADITIVSEGDAVKATNDDQDSEGYIAITGGSFEIETESDGFSAEGSILITGGEFNIETNPGYSSANTSSKAFKAGIDLTITGGTFILETEEDDTLHSNQSIHISGGTFTLNAGDDGIHADEALIIEDGDISIESSYEGLEGFNVYVIGGIIDIEASDDGINTANTAAESLEFGMGGGGDESVGEMLLVITGGEITINSVSDGLDSNGYIYMSGGSVEVFGPITDREGPLDSNGDFIISGGTLIGSGSIGMIEGPISIEGQGTVMMTYSSPVSAGTIVTLTDSEGAILAATTSDKQFQAAFFSLQEITEGDGYTVTTDNGVSVTFTAAEDTIWLDESGVTEAIVIPEPGGNMGGGRMDRGQRPEGMEMPPARTM